MRKITRQEAEHAMVLQALAPKSQEASEPVRRNLSAVRRHNAKLLAASRTTKEYRQLREQGYMTSVEVSSMAGISLRQLQWWDEQGFACPLIVRHARLYSPALVIRVRATADMRRLGLRLDAASKLMEKPAVSQWLDDREAALPNWLLTDGRRYRLLDAAQVPHEIIQFQKHAPGKVYLFIKPTVQETVKSKGI